MCFLNAHIYIIYPPNYTRADTSLSKNNLSYLLLLTALQVSPLLHRLAQINAVHRNLYLTNLVVFGETVKVENLQHQSLSAQLGIWDLKRGMVTVLEYRKVKVDSRSRP